MHYHQLIKLELKHSFAAELDVGQFSDQVRMRLASQLITGISRVLQELLKYFNGTIIWTAFVPSFPVEPVIFYLYLNEVLLPGKLSGAPALFKATSFL